jgi:hypothetical protein
VEGEFSVRLHPDGQLVVGDLVSFEVIAPPEADLRRNTLAVYLGDTQLGEAEFGGYGIGQRKQATLLWAWDTAGLFPGWHTLSFIVQPGGPVWLQPVYLAPAESLALLERQAIWLSAENDCCTLHYLSGSQAEQDLPILIEMVDQVASRASQRMGASFEGRVDVVFLARVLGHGGFASQEIAVSYLGRNYAGGDPAIVLHHELVHLLDSQMGGDLRPALLSEGLAVYMSGGHFKSEPLPERAAALLQLGAYIPLASLADNFYPAQHEAGYLQGGALVGYMIERWGWEAYNGFYRDIHRQLATSTADALDAALRKHFGIGLKSLEEAFLAYLEEQSVSEAVQEDLRLSLAYYDTLRRYQRLLDPSAYYLTAWLPDSRRMRARGVSADYLRTPGAPENVLVEWLLVVADHRLRAGEYPAVERLLESVNLGLDQIEQDRQNPVQAR